MRVYLWRFTFIHLLFFGANLWTYTKIMGSFVSVTWKIYQDYNKFIPVGVLSKTEVGSDWYEWVSSGISSKLASYFCHFNTTVTVSISELCCDDAVVEAACFSPVLLNWTAYIVCPYLISFNLFGSILFCWLSSDNTSDFLACEISGDEGVIGTLLLLTLESNAGFLVQILSIHGVLQWGLW